MNAAHKLPDNAFACVNPIQSFLMTPMGQDAIGNASPSTRRIVVIRRHIPPLRDALKIEALIFGLLAGLVLSIGITIVGGNTGSGITGLAMIFATLAWPVWSLCRNHRSIVHAARAAQLGRYYGAGTLIVVYLVTAMHLLSIAGDYLLLILGALLVCILPLIAATVAISLGFMALWALLRLILPKFVEQDGTLCLNCAYCLIGVHSMRCPECGNAFTFDDLETTAEEFASRAVTSN